MISRLVVATIGSRIATSCLGLTTSIVSARLLGPEGRGQYFYLVTAAFLSAQFANLGLASANTFYGVRDKSAIRDLFGNSLLVAAVCGTTAAAATLAFLCWFSQPVSTVSAILAVCLCPLSLLYLFLSNLLVAMNESRAYNWAQVLQGAVVFALCLAMAVTQPTVGAFLSATTLGTALLCALLFAHVWKRAGRPRINLDRLRDSIAYAARAYITTLLGFLVLRANVFLLERWADAAEVGRYSVATQIVDTLTIIPQSMGLWLFPDLVRDSAGRWSATMRSVRVGLMVLVGACIAVAVASKLVIPLAFGAQYTGSINILLALLPGTIFVGLITIMSQFLAAEGFPAMLPFAWSLALAVVLMLGWILIHRLGGLGAAIGLSGGYAVLLILVLIASHVIQHRREKQVPI